MAFPIPGRLRPQFLESSGAPLSSGTVTVLDPADDMNKATYPTANDADNATNANANPITLNASGEVPSGFFGIGGEKYKLVLKDSDGATVYTDDNIKLPADSAADLRSIPFPTTSAETAAGVLPSNFQYQELDVRRYGAVADGATDCSDAINDAISVAVSYTGTHAEDGGAEIVLPQGTLRCESNVSMRDHVTLRGHYNGTILEFNGCALVFDAASAADDIFSRHIVEWSLQNIRVKRIGTAGFAVQFITDGGTGSSDNRDVVRFNVQNLYIVRSTGGGMSITGTYLGSFWNTFIRNCSGTGLSIQQQTNGGGGNINSAKSLAFFGGEIQGCDKAADLRRLQGVNFYGVAWEGNDEGIEINKGASIGVYGGYFEANGMYDIQVGPNTAEGPVSLTISGNFFESGSAKDYAIDLIRATNVVIENNSFDGPYSVAGINRNGASATSVTGIARLNAIGATGPSAILANANASFHEDPVASVLTGSTTEDVASIADGDQAAFNIAVTGAAVGDFVQVSANGAMSDLQMTGYVNTADNVRVIIQNNTGSPVDLPSRFYRAIVTPRTIWFP